MDWFFHRIAASRYYSAGLDEIRERWTLTDVIDAHLVLDSYVEAGVEGAF